MGLGNHQMQPPVRCEKFGVLGQGKQGVRAMFDQMGAKDIVKGARGQWITKSGDETCWRNAARI